MQQFGYPKKRVIIMDIILRKNRLKHEYVFYSNQIIIKKNGEIVRLITTSDIVEATYNEKFGFIDFIMIFFGNVRPYNNFPKALVILLKSKPKYITIKLKKNEYEILKQKFNVKIDVI